MGPVFVVIIIMVIIISLFFQIFVFNPNASKMENKLKILKEEYEENKDTVIKCSKCGFESKMKDFKLLYNVNLGKFGDKLFEEIKKSDLYQTQSIDWKNKCPKCGNVF